MRIAKYLSWVAYNALELVSCVINTVLSIFGIHTYISWGTDLLAWVEASRINKEIDARAQKRDFLAMEAETKAEEAKKEVLDLGIE